MPWDLRGSPPTLKCEIGGDSLCSGVFVLKQEGSVYGASRVLPTVPKPRYGPYRLDYTLSLVFDEPALTVQLVDLADLAVVGARSIPLTGHVGQYIDLHNDALLDFLGQEIDSVSVSSVESQGRVLGDPSGIIYVGEEDIFEDNTDDTISIPTPAGTQTGDTLVAVVYTQENTTGIGRPAGFTEVASGFWKARNGFYSLSYKTATNSEPTYQEFVNQGFVFGDSSTFGGMLLYRGTVNAVTGGSATGFGSAALSPDLNASRYSKLVGSFHTIPTTEFTASGPTGLNRRFPGVGFVSIDCMADVEVGLGQTGSYSYNIEESGGPASGDWLAMFLLLGGDTCCGPTTVYAHLCGMSQVCACWNEELVTMVWDGSAWVGELIPC